MKIQHSSSPNSFEVDFLTRKLDEETPEFGQTCPFAFFARDKENQIIAGCNGIISYGGIYTDQLWVHANYRNKGIGRNLMERVHQHGQQSGCIIATVITMSFHGAKGFYEKLGYIMDHERSGHARNSNCLFLRKDL